MKDVLTEARRAASLGGEILLEHFGRLKRSEVDEKAENDYVTSVDTSSEEAILSHLRSTFPNDSFLAEESGFHGKGDREWVIDPLDGTKNYIHGIPWFCVSIALLEKGRAVAGLVHDPVRNVFFTAERACGAFRNEERIHVSDARGIDGTLLATGFPFRAKEHIDPYFRALANLFRRVSGIRRAGSAALDLALVAQGAFDGFFELGLSAWDIAAGALLIEEAGGIVTDFENGEDYLRTGNVVAGPLAVHRELLGEIRGVFGDQPDRAGFR